MRAVSALVLILLLGLALRVYPAIHHPGMFMEPDVYIYYSVASQTLAHNMTITSQLSGVPPNRYSEFPGLVLVPASLALLTGYSPGLFIEWLPVLMGLLGILLVYLLAYEFMHTRWMALLASFLYAVLPAALYRSMAGEYRGEVFVPVFLAAIMLLLIKTDRRTAWWTVPPAIGLAALSIWFWSGGIYVLVPIGLFICAALAFKLFPRVLKRTAADPLLKNRLTYAVLVAGAMIAYPLALYLFSYFANLVGGFTKFQTSFISELAPVSVSYLFTYYAWVFIAAIIGLGLMVYYGRKETFYKPQFALFSLFLPSIVMMSLAARWLILFAVPGTIYGAYAVFALFSMFPVPKRTQMIIVVGLCAVALMLGLDMILPLAPADFINPQFLSALSWLRANTAANATILTMWPDGSVVEGYALRESYSDSIMSQDTNYTIGFERFLYAKAGNYTYLDKVNPTYLLVRQPWLYETYGILIEVGYPLNTSYNGTNMQQFLQINGTRAPPYPVAYKNNDTIIYRIG